MIDSVRPFTGIASGDGGCIITGDNYLYSLKIEPAINILWNRIYDSFSGPCYKIIKTNNNNFVMCGRKPYNDGIIAEIDSVGNLIWYRQYPAPNYEIYHTICEAENEGYVAAGIYLDISYSMGYGLITRVDNTGNIIWEKKFDYNIYKFNDFVTINKISNGYLLTAGITDTTIGQVRNCLIKIDTSGNLRMIKIIPDDTLKHNYTKDLKIINPNKYLLTSIIENENYDTAQAKIFIIDSSGNIIKKKVFSETNYNYFNNTLIINENSYLLVGASNYINPNIENIYVVRTDSNLVIPPIGVTGIKKYIPENFYLFQNYPNPFNPVTKIKFDLPYSENVTIKIYDIIGRELAVLENNEYKEAGTYQIEWNATNYASGVYFYRIEVSQAGSSIVQFTNVKKMVLVK